jgi:hypothetical protein
MNMVGFGSLMIASHQGLYSLGRVLTLGMTCNLLSGLLMPSLLRVLQRMRGTHREPGSVEPDAQPLRARPSPALAEPETVAIRRRVQRAA